MDAREEVMGATWLASRYQVAGLRARGALCLVYQGQDAVLQRPVAIKAPLVGQRDAYMSTLALTSALAHPAFLALYDVVEQGDGLFLAYEFVDGRPIADYVAAGLPLRRALALMLQVTRALAYAHAHGVAHGDLTPAAILVDRAAVARVTNVGMPPDGAYFDEVVASAHASGLADDPDTTAATLAERIEYLDTWADAAILWQLITDTLPSADSAADNAADGAARVRTLRADTPDRLLRIIERALRVSHPDAITTAESLEAELAVIDRTLAEDAAAGMEQAPPTIVALRESRRRSAASAAGAADQAGAIRWRGARTVSPTATTSYGDLDLSAQVDEDVSMTQPLDDAVYEPRAPRLQLPARPLTQTDPRLGKAAHAGRTGLRRWQAGAPASGVAMTQDGLSGWIWALIAVAVFALCFLIGFFLAPVIPTPHLP